MATSELKHNELGDLICDAGCVLQDLDNYLVERGYQVINNE